MKLNLSMASTCLALLSSAALADNQSMVFACDTPPGHFSSWSQTLSTRGIEVEGKLKINELRKDKQWAPVVNVYVEAEGKASYGFHVTGFPKQPDTLFTEMIKAGEKAPIGPLAGMVPNGKDPIPFKFKLDATGAFTVNVGGAESTAQVGTVKISGFTLSCSTVDVEFSDVRLTAIN